MAEVGTFPFGWIRGIRGDNWQIIWDPKTELLVAHAAVSKESVELGKSAKWMEAKVYADKVKNNPEPFFS